ncbi:hypothetical protein MDAP_002245 [Mitosporidium daphniae]
MKEVIISFAPLDYLLEEASRKQSLKEAEFFYRKSKLDTLKSDRDQKLSQQQQQAQQPKMEPINKTFEEIPYRRVEANRDSVTAPPPPFLSTPFLYDVFLESKSRPSFIKPTKESYYSEKEVAAISVVQMCDVPTFGQIGKKPNLQMTMGDGNLQMKTAKVLPHKSVILKTKQPKSKDLIVLNQKKRDLRSIEEIQLELRRGREMQSTSGGSEKKTLANVNAPTVSAAFRSQSQTIPIPGSTEHGKRNQKLATLKRLDSVFMNANSKNVNGIAVTNHIESPVKSTQRDNSERLERKDDTVVPKRKDDTVVPKRKDFLVNPSGYPAVKVARAEDPALKKKARHIGQSSAKLRIEDSDFDDVLNEDAEKFYEKNYSSVIGKLFNYDKFRFCNEDQGDLSDMEVGFSGIRREENRSAKIAMFEDRRETLLLKKLHLKNKN